MQNNPKISDAAREAEQKAITASGRRVLGYTDQPERGHFVQQLLDAEREKWEKGNIAALGDDFGTPIIELIDTLKEQKNQLREQLLEAQKALPDLLGHPATAETIAAFESHHAATESIVKDLQKELLEHKAAIAVKDEALKPFAAYFNGTLEDVGGGTYVSPGLKVQYFKDAKATLSPNCGQPLLELVREMKTALKEVSRFNTSIASDGLVDRALTKAKHLGF